MKDSGIEWTTHTFNPWWGCTKVSPGCAHCYAETLDTRFAKGGPTHWGPGAPRKPASEATWRAPRAWNAQAAKEGVRARVFCASMADVFDAEAPGGALERLWGLIRDTPMLDWQLLTKRPERIAASLPPDWGEGYANVWLGTSVEDQKRANERIPVLSLVPARVRFLSCEPLIGPVDLQRVLIPDDASAADVARLTRPLGQQIHWVITGGESGHGARAMRHEWASHLQKQCAEEGIAFFFKQWGHVANNPDPRDATAKENGGTVKGGALLDGRRHTAFPSP